MATFAPAPQYDPGQLYTNWERPVNEPMVDVSGLTKGKAIGKGLSELGSTIEGGLKVAGQATEAKAGEEFRHGWEGQAGNDQNTQEAVDRLTGVAKQLDVLTGDVEATKNMPDELKQLPKQLDRLDSAMSGKRFIKRYIDGQRWELAKNLRTRYPGFREYIDGMISRSTREDPANQYIGQIEADINNLQTQLGERKSKVDGLVLKGVDEQLDGAREMFAMRQASKATDQQVVNWYYAAQGDKGNINKLEQAVKMAKGNHELEGYAAGNYVSAQIGQIGNQVQNSLRTQLKLTNEELAKKVLMGGSDIHLSDTESQLLLGQQIAGRAEALARFDHILDTDAGDGRTYRQMLTPPQVAEYRAQLEARFSNNIDMYENKAHGLAHINENFVEGKTHEAEYGLSTNKNTAVLYSIGRAVGKLPGFPKVLADALIEQNMPANLSNYFNFTSQEAVSQMLPETRDLRLNVTMKKDIEDTTTKGVKGKALDQYTQAKLNLVDKITDPNWPDEAKLGLAKYAFSPQNAGFIDKLRDEDKAPTFKRLYSDAMTKEMRKLDLHSPGGHLWQNYTKLAYQQFGSELFHPEIMDLNQYPGNKNVSITWDNVNHQFATHYWGDSENAQDKADWMRTDYSIWKINQGLGAISNIAKIEHGDVNAYVYKLLTSAGLSPDSEAAKVLMAVHATGKFPEQEEPKE